VDSTKRSGSALRVGPDYAAGQPRRRQIAQCGLVLVDASRASAHGRGRRPAEIGGFCHRAGKPPASVVSPDSAGVGARPNAAFGESAVWRRGPRDPRRGGHGTGGRTGHQGHNGRVRNSAQAGITRSRCWRAARTSASSTGLAPAGIGPPGSRRSSREATRAGARMDHRETRNGVLTGRLRMAGTRTRIMRGFSFGHDDKVVQHHSRLAGGRRGAVGSCRQRNMTSGRCWVCARSIIHNGLSL